MSADPIAVLAATARAWRDPAYGPRAEAVRRLLDAAPIQTEEAVAFALNEATHAATEDALARLAGPLPRSPARVAVWTDEGVPLAGWHDALAALVRGHPTTVHLPAPDSLLAAFCADAQTHGAVLDVQFAEVDDPLPDGLGAVLGTGSDEAMADLAARCDTAGVGPDRRLLRGDAPAVAVLDGRETGGERIGLAEDVLLYPEARRRVRIVWAPEEQSPDPLLDALAGFRELFPAPAPLDGRLQMPRAFLKAAGASHAWGDGFLVSKGPPEGQGAGHVRWTPYASLDDVRAWLEEASVGLVVAAPRVQAALAWQGETAAPGDAHRSGLKGPNPLDLLGRN